MASLNDTAYISRIAIKYGAIALVVMIVGRFAFGVMLNIYHAMFPSPPDPPSVGFGILPPLEFPENEYGNITYSLETPTNTIPQFLDRIDVYKYILERPSLLAYEQATDEAKHLGFEDNIEQLTDSVFRWSTVNEYIPAYLEMDIYDGTFALQYDWTKSPNFLIEKRLVNEVESSERVKDLLHTPGLLPEDLYNSEYEVTYVKVFGRSYQETTSLSDADFIQLDFFRQPVQDLYPVVTKDPNNGVVQALISTNPSQAWLVYLEYNYYPVDYEDSHTYPLKSGVEAWNELVNGDGYIASLDDNIDDVVIRRVELGYYDAFDKQPYLQPVYIFRGDDSFVAYVQAVRKPTISTTPFPER